MALLRVYPPTETRFTDNGLKTIEARKAVIYKQNNGDYYLSLKCHIKYADYIVQDNIITVMTPWGLEGFRIDNPKIVNNTIECKAWQLFYDGENYIVPSLELNGLTGTNALYSVNLNASPNSPFSTSGDISSVTSITTKPQDLCSAMFDLARIYDAQLDRNLFNVSIKNSIGTDRQTVIKLGKNMTNFEQQEDWSMVVTQLMPVGIDGILIDDVYLYATGVSYDKPYARVVQFEPSDDVDISNTEDIKADLLSQATKYLNTYKVPKVSYTMSANLDYVELGDTIHVKHPKVNVDLLTHVKAFEWDCVTEKYQNIVFGNAYINAKTQVQGALEKHTKQLSDSIIDIGRSLQDSKNTIKHFLYEGHRYETDNATYYLNASTPEQATRFMIISLGGIGFGTKKQGDSITGNETYTTAWNIDGTFNADYITTGTLESILIKGCGIELTTNNGKNRLSMNATTIKLQKVSGNTLTDVLYLDSDGHLKLVFDGSDVDLANNVAIKNLQSGITGIEQDLNSVASDVSEVVANLQAEITRATGAEANMYTKAQCDSKISQSATSIKNEVASTYVTQATYNNMQIGGRNFARGTANSATATATTPTANNTWGEPISKSWWATSPLTLIKGQSYVLSFDYVLDWTNCVSAMPTIKRNIGCGIGSGDSYSTPAYSGDTFDTCADFVTYGGSYERGHFVYNFAYSFNSTRYFAFRILRSLSIDITGLTITVSNFKIEKGSKATDWTPAIEDTDASIQSVNNKFASYSTTTQMNTVLEQKENAILSEVAESYATKIEIQTVDNKFASYVKTSDYNTKVTELSTGLSAEVTAREELKYGIIGNNCCDNGVISDDDICNDDEDSLVSNLIKDTIAKLEITSERFTVNLQDRILETQSTFEQRADEITSVVEDLSSDTNTKFEQTANDISLKVSKGNIISEINLSSEVAKISASRIELTGYLTISNFEGNGITFVNGNRISTTAVITSSVIADEITGSKVACGNMWMKEQCLTSSGTMQLRRGGEYGTVFLTAQSSVIDFGLSGSSTINLNASYTNVSGNLSVKGSFSMNGATLTGNVTIGAGTSYSSNNALRIKSYAVGFFGHDPHTKQSILTTSLDTVSGLRDKLNEVISALQGYGLF